MRKILSIFIAVVALMQVFGVVSFAGEINAFPPQRPQLGNMKVAVGLGYMENSDTVVALRSNGTVNIRPGQYHGIDLICESSVNYLKSLTNVVDVACISGDIAILTSDGKVHVSSQYENTQTIKPRFEEAENWTDVVAIVCGREHLVGLKADGSTFATGKNNEGQCDVSGWNNVSKIYANENTTIAIKKDGTVLATGSIGNYSELRKESDIVDVFAVNYGSLSGDKYEVIKSDGTITVADYAYVSDDNKITDIGGGKNTQLDINTMLKMLGHSKKIVSFAAPSAGGHYSKYYFLDENGDFYLLSKASYKAFVLEKLEENILGFIEVGGDYYAWDKNGQIFSNEVAFTSDDWILTTNIMYNNEKIDSDVPPYIKDGRTLAPVRAILEALGMIVTWDGDTQTATAVKGDVTISVTINSNIAYVNGAEKQLDVPAEITGSRTFVPVRFFAEALNMKVDWDSYTKTVIIND